MDEACVQNALLPTSIPPSSTALWGGGGGWPGRVVLLLQDTSLAGGPQEPPKLAAYIFIHNVCKAPFRHLTTGFLIIARMTCTGVD